MTSDQLRDSRYEFAVTNKLPARYKAIMSQTYAHSDDEYNEEHKVHIITTLGYRSSNANKFMRRYDALMARSSTISGKTPQGRVRKLPKVPQLSQFKSPPVQLPLDFYDPQWYNGLSATQKEKLVKHTQVALLPDAAKSFIPAPHTHPDEKISGQKFNAKYHERLSMPYIINTCEDESEGDAEGPVARGDQGIHEEDMEDSIDLEAASEGSDAEDKAANNPFYEDGEYGDLYNEESDGEWDGEKEDEDEDDESDSESTGKGEDEQMRESEEDEGEL